MPIVPVYVGVVKSVLGYSTRKESPNSLGTLFVKAVRGGTDLRLLHIVMGLMVEDHAFANHFDGLEILEHDRFAAFGTNAVGEMVDLFTVCERGARRF